MLMVRSHWHTYHSYAPQLVYLAFGEQCQCSSMIQTHSKLTFEPIWIILPAPSPIESNEFVAQSWFDAASNDIVLTAGSVAVTSDNM